MHEIETVLFVEAVERKPTECGQNDSIYESLYELALVLFAIMKITGDAQGVSKNK